MLAAGRIVLYTALANTASLLCAPNGDFLPLFFSGKCALYGWESETADSSSDAERLVEATAKFLRKLSDHGRAPWPAILKWSEKTHAVEVRKSR